MRNYQISIIQASSQPIAVIRDRARLAELSTKVPRYCGEVWEFVRSGVSDAKSPGRHVAIYFNNPGENSLATPQGAMIEVGVEIAAPFTGNGRVISSTIPAGPAVTTTHFGSYSELGGAYDALIKWCKDNGRSGTGVCWEIYGHRTEDPEKLRTDIFCQLA